MLAGGVLAVCLAGAGCGASGKTTGKPSGEGVPADFALALAVPTDFERAAVYPEDAPVLLPVRLVVEADGTLRAREGNPGLGAGEPARVRVLGAAQRATLHRALAQAGVLDPRAPLAVVGDEAALLAGQPRRAIALTWAANGRTRTVAVTPAPTDGPDYGAWLGVREALTLLRSWAWLDGGSGP